MDNVDLDVLRQAAQWVDDGHRVVLGTLTRTWGSAPRPPGALVAVRADGRLAGSVSGGCIEDDLMAQACDGTLATDRPRVVEYGVDATTAGRVGLPCGGRLEIVLEPVQPATRLPELLDRLARGERVRRVLALDSGRVELHPGARTDTLTLDATQLVTPHGPRWRLLLIGAGQLSRYVAEMALALGYEVIVCDPREGHADGLAVPGVTLRREMPDDVVRALAPDDHLAVIALTHDPKLDDLALLEALRSGAFYVGAIGSQRHQAQRRERLRTHFDLDDAALDRLHGPVGLAIGARTPPEIAIAILAELTAVRHGRGGAARAAAQAQAGGS